MWWWLACADPTTPTGDDTPAAHTGGDDSPTLPPPDHTGEAPPPHTGDPATTWPGVPGTYTGTTRGRDWVLFVPPSYDPRGSPLVVAFHGAGDTAQNFAVFVDVTGWTAAADAQGFLVLVPGTLSPYDDFAIWSGNPNDDLDEMEAELDDVLALVDELGATWHPDPASLHAFGFSDGGLFLAVAGMARADRVASLGIFGYGWGGFEIVTPPREPPVAFVVGDRDSFASGAVASEAFLGSRGYDTRLDVVPGVGHSFSGLMGGVAPAELAAWMLARPLP